MAITHKRQDDLETLFANFASVPGNKEKTVEPDPKTDETNEKDDK